MLRHRSRQRPRWWRPTGRPGGASSGREGRAGHGRSHWLLRGSAPPPGRIAGPLGGTATPAALPAGLLGPGSCFVSSLGLLTKKFVHLLKRAASHGTLENRAHWAPRGGTRGTPARRSPHRRSTPPAIVRSAAGLEAVSSRLLRRGEERCLQHKVDALARDGAEMDRCIAC